MSLPNIAHADVKLAAAVRPVPLQGHRAARPHPPPLLHPRLDQGDGPGRRASSWSTCGAWSPPCSTPSRRSTPSDVAPEVLAAATADPESETYQFVVRAVIDDGDAVTASLAERALAVDAERDDERRRRVAVEGELERAREEVAELRRQLDDSRGRGAAASRS